MLIQIKLREPDFYIGGKENPYLRRWWLTNRIPEKCKVYLHNFLRDDEDRAPHDHPSDSLSIGIWGRYKEHMADGSIKIRYPFIPVWRKATDYHRIELFRDKNGNIKQAWTVFTFGPKLQDWGFRCPQGKIMWWDFTDANDSGSVGKGCGE